jgi:membrane protein
MFQIISVFLTLVLLYAYLVYKEKAKKKYSGSIVFEIIDREYSNWYKKEGNGTVINKKTASMFEVDKVVFKLKEKFENQGVTREQLKDYLNFLSNDDPKKVGFYGIIISVFGYFGIDKLKSLFPQLNNITDISKLFKDIADTFNTYSNVVLIVLYFIFFIGILALLLYISYKLATIDNMYIDTQKIYVLKRVEKIWDFEKDDSVFTTTEAKNIFKDRNNLIFTKLSNSRSKFDEDFDRAIGDTFNTNKEFFKNLPLIRIFKWQAIKEWFLGMLLPVILLSSIFTLCYYMLNNDQLHFLFYLAFYILSLSVVYLFMLIYLTLIDKQNKVIVPEQTNVGNSEQTEASNSEEVEMVSQTEASNSESLNSKKVQLKIKRRKPIKKQIYVTFAITLYINYILCLLLVNGLNNIDLSICGVIDNVCSFFMIFSKNPITLFLLHSPLIISFLVIIFSTFFQIESVNE